MFELEFEVVMVCLVELIAIKVFVMVQIIWFYTNIKSIRGSKILFIANITIVVIITKVSAVKVNYVRLEFVFVY